MASVFRSAGLLLAVTTLGACGDPPLQPVTLPPGPGTPPVLPYTVTVTADRDTVSPGDTASVHIDLTTSDSTAVILEFGVRLGGLLNDSAALLQNISGNWELGLFLPIPTGRREGVLAITVYARLALGEAKGVDTVWVYDRRPPVVTLNEFPAYAQPGRTVGFTWTATDNAAVRRTVVEMTGAVVHSDTTQYGNLPTWATRQVTASVSPDATLGDSIMVQLIAIDLHELADTLIPAPIRLRDLTPPQVQVALAPHPYEPVINGEPVYVTGDTIRATVTVRDERGLAWAGWFIPVQDTVLVRDSVAVSGADATVSVEIVVDTAWHAFAQRFAAFARDSTDNLAEARGAQMWLYDRGVRRPYVTVSDAGIEAVADLAYDDRRHRIYLSRTEEQEVAVLDAATGLFDPPIAMPGPPVGIDMLPGNDTLIVVLAETPYLAVVDLTGATPVVDTLRMHDLGYPQRVPRRVRVTANRWAFVALDSRMPFADDSVTYLVDFSTGEQRLFPALGWGDEIFRSGDRSTVMTYSEWGYVYRTQTDSVEAYPWIYLPARPELDRAGRYAISAHRLYDLSFQWIGTVVPESRIVLGWGITADGDAAYYGFPDEWGYTKLRLSDGAVIERVPLPGAWVNRLTEIGDGRFLLVGGRGSAPRYIVDLR